MRIEPFAGMRMAMLLRCSMTEIELDETAGWYYRNTDQHPFEDAEWVGPFSTEGRAMVASREDQNEPQH